MQAYKTTIEDIYVEISEDISEFLLEESDFDTDFSFFDGDAFADVDSIYNETKQLQLSFKDYSFQLLDMLPPKPPSCKYEPVEFDCGPSLQDEINETLLDNDICIEPDNPTNDSVTYVITSHQIQGSGAEEILVTLNLPPTDTIFVHLYSHPDTVVQFIKGHLSSYNQQAKYKPHVRSLYTLATLVITLDYTLLNYKRRKKANPHPNAAKCFKYMLATMRVLYKRLRVLTSAPRVIQSRINGKTSS